VVDVVAAPVPDCPVCAATAKLVAARNTMAIAARFIEHLPAKTRR
jgi:hypothetical protein